MELFVVFLLGMIPVLTAYFAFSQLLFGKNDPSLLRDQAIRESQELFNAQEEQYDKE